VLVIQTNKVNKVALKHLKIKFPEKTKPTAHAKDPGLDNITYRNKQRSING
jgi:hypothetical protein